MPTLPPSSKAILRALGKEGAMTHHDIVKKTHFKPRTVRYALKKLKENKLLIEKMNIHDMRQIIYQHRVVPLQEAGIPKEASGMSEAAGAPSSAPAA